MKQPEIRQVYTLMKLLSCYFLNNYYQQGQKSQFLFVVVPKSMNRFELEVNKIFIYFIFSGFTETWSLSSANKVTKWTRTAARIKPVITRCLKTQALSDWNIQTRALWVRILPLNWKAFCWWKIIWCKSRTQIENFIIPYESSKY